MAVNPTEPNHVWQPQLWETVADRIRQWILTGELTSGSKLVETELAERLGTSRGPIREAMRELAHEGLVVERPRRGTYVSSLTVHDLAEVWGVREALEVSAASIAIQRATDAELVGLGEHVRRLRETTEAGEDVMRRSSHDLAFHRGLVRLAGNARMSSVYEDMLGQSILLLSSAAKENEVMRTAMRLEIHEEIYGGVAARDERRAGDAIRAHYRYGEERLIARREPGDEGGSGLN